MSTPGWPRAAVAARIGLAAFAVAAILVLELRVPALLIGATLLAAWRLPVAVLTWIMLAAPLFIPLYRMRNGVVYFAAAYLPLLLGYLAIDLALRRRTWLAPSPLNLPLFGLALVAVLSGIQGALFYDPSVPGVHRFVLMQVYAVVLVALCAGAALLVANTLNDARLIFMGYAAVIGVGLYITVASVAKSYTVPLPTWAFMIVAQASALMYALLLHGLPASFWARSLAAGVVIHGLYIVILYPLLGRGGQWISGWLGFGVPLAVITVLRFPRASAVLAPIGAAAGAWGLWPFIERAYTQAAWEGDFIRLVIWRDALHVASMRPLLGVGPGNYIDYVERYATTLPFGSAHGNYQQVVAEMGGIGLIALLWVLGAALHLGWRQYRRCADPLRSALALGALGAVAGQATASVVGDYLVPSYHNAGHSTVCSTLYVWILMGLLAAGWRVDRSRGA